MFNLKQAIAATIVCFKPQIFLVVCIILVIFHSILQAVQRGTDSSFFIAKQNDFTLTMTAVVILVALVWGALFILLIRYELRTEVECLLTLFQCSKRGLRFLGVVAFHVGLVAFVALLVSIAVERTIPLDINTKASNNGYIMTARQLHRAEFSEQRSHGECRPVPTSAPQDNLGSQKKQTFFSNHIEPVGCHTTNQKSHLDHDSESSPQSIANRKYISTVYKIWLTAIVYAFLYVVLENLIMFHTDMSLIEFVHEAFHIAVSKITGVDLSDYPAGEMLLNPLVRRRFR